MAERRRGAFAHAPQPSGGVDSRVCAHHRSHQCVFQFSEQLGGGYLHFGGFAQRADVNCEQLTDACGYKAANAVVRMRHAALADDDTWLSAELLDDSWVIADKPTSL